MVNRLRKGLWFLLIVFLAYFSSPGYPDSKTKTIHNLPVNQDMGTKSWRTSEDEKIVLEAMEQSDCPDCWTTLNNAIRCRRCVELKEDCQDCCFSGEDPSTRIIKCTEEDTSGDYKCKPELFDRDECDQVVCDKEDDDDDYTSDCMSKCTDYEDYESGSACVEEKQTGGKPKTSEPYGLQRRGCPEEDSDDLAPDGSCSLVGTGSGLDRKWKCTSDWLKPKFAVDYIDKTLCAPNSDLTFINSKPDSSWSYGDYYAVTKVSPSCTSSDSCSQSCPGSCEKKGKNCAGQACNPPDCTPKCPDACSYTCVSVSCTTPDQSTSDCVCSASQCSTPSCTPSCSSSCGSNGCSSPCTSSCFPDSDDYYVYTLSEKYQNYITECIKKADEYEECADRVNCCEKRACQDISAKNKKTKEYECTPGFSDNCKYCEKRECYHNDIVDNCKEFTAIGVKKSCPQLASDVHSCLTMPKNSGCFKEIKTGGKTFSYPYVASSNDALNIIWQIITSTSSDKDVKGLNFYTLVKVWKLNESGEKAELTYTSMANVKSQEAAFSIYGTTNVAKGKLDAGASYGVYLYYSLPPGEFCDVDCEKPGTCESETTIELTYVSLILQRVRE